jgi:hypothetical protein
MRQERTIQATIFEAFAEHEIGCALKAISEWLDGQRRLVSRWRAICAAKEYVRRDGKGCRRGRFCVVGYSSDSGS